MGTKTDRGTRAAAPGIGGQNALDQPCDPRHLFIVNSKNK